MNANSFGITADRWNIASESSRMKRVKNKRWFSVFGSVLALIISTMLSEAWAGPIGSNGDKSNWITISGRGVLLIGQHATDVQLRIPGCPANTEFLVLGLDVGPEVNIGATMIDVVNLGQWAASVPVYQRGRTGAVQVALTALGQGPEHVSTTLPSGQSINRGTTIPVTIRLLGGPPLVTASRRFEFNVHVTGACGHAFVSPQ